MAKYSVRGPDGNTYSIEGPEGASDEDVIAEIQRQNPQVTAPITDTAATVSPGAAPVAASATPSATADASVTPLKTVAVQGLGGKNDFAFEPKTADEIKAAMANPDISPEDVQNLINQRLTEAGQAPLGVAGGPNAIAEYRKNLAKAKAQPGDISYTNVVDQLPIDKTPTATPTTPIDTLLSSIFTHGADPDAFGNLKRGYQEAVQYGTPGFIAREYASLSGQGTAELKKAFPNLNDDQIEQLRQSIIAKTQEGVRASNAEATANDPTIPHMMGMLPGSAGPEDFIPGGEAAGFAQRTGRAVAQNAATDVAYQGLDIHQGVQDSYNPEQTLAAGALGGALHLGVEGTHAALATTKDRTPIVSEAQQAANRYDDRTNQYIQQSGKKPTQAVRQEAAANAAADHINDVTNGWVNPPEFEVHNNFSKLPIADKDAIGMIDDSGKVVVNMKAVNDEAKAQNVHPTDVLTAVTYHEALGHHGMTQAFGDGLDDILTHMYDNGPTFQRKVDTWLKDNPDAYKDSPDRVARGADEVLAEMSEKGQMPVSITDRFKNYIKDTARKMGINWDYSTREIRSILGMAHNGVIDGKIPTSENSFVGSRYMSPNREQAFMEYANAQNVRPSQLFDDLENGKNPEAEETIKAREAQLAGRAQPKPVDESAPRGMYDAEKTDALTQKAYDEPGKVHTARVWPRDQSIVDFKYGDPETKSIISGAFIKKGKAAEDLEIYGDGRNTIGPKSLQSIRRQIKEQFPELDKIEATRISGARKGGKTVGYAEGDPVSVRFMKRKSKDISNDDIFESENALKNLRAITEDYTPVTMSMDELRHEAEARGLSPDRLLKNKALDLGELPRRFIMQDIAAEKLNDKVTALNNKIQNGGGTYRDRDAHLTSLLKFKELSARIFDEQGEAGRLLRTIQDLTYTKKKVNATREALEGLSTEDLQNLLDNPEEYMRFAKGIQDQLAQAKDSLKNGKAKEGLASVLNIPRALMSSVDLSAPFRQGLFMVGRPEFWKGLPDMLKYFASKGAFENLMTDITKRSTYPKMVHSGLSFSGNEGKLSSHEEAFQSNLAEKVPLVAASERAYVGFLNKLRADTFDSLLSEAKNLGVDTDKDKFNKDLAKFINHATGRGDLGGALNSAAPLLNSLFFSPRLIASRVQLLNPAFYVRLDPFVRQQAIKSLLSTAGFVSTVLSLSALAGAKVQTDPRSTDFGKAQVGDTRYDLLGGFAQYITLGARLLAGEEKSATGEIKPYGNKFGQKTRLDTSLTFAMNKTAPVPSFIIDALRGTDTAGQPFNLKTAAASRFIPMFIQDFMDVSKEYGYGQGSVRAVPGIVGVGIQNYTPTAIDPNKEVEAPDSFTMQEAADGENSLVSVKDGTVSLKGKAQDEWKRRVNFYSKEWMKDEMADPKWKKMTLQEKADAIKSVHNDAKKQTKEDMIPLLGLDGGSTN